MKLSPWHHHPAVRSGEQLTRGERWADIVRNGMGSWPFVITFLIAMVLWAIVNTFLIARLLHGHPFDPYPYILLNLMLSTMAGLQAAILLIAAKRADQVAAEQALHHLELSQETKQLLEQNTALTQAVETLTAEIHSTIVQTS